MVVLRTATADDAGFLLRVVALAVDWRPGPVRDVQEVLVAPGLAHYAVGWPQAGEQGVLAEADEGPVGAAWWRFLPQDDPGYGFVAADVAEVTLGVLHGHRGCGVGTRLLTELVAQARTAGPRALSLSVEPDNPALRLYSRLGFTTVGGVGGSLTMLLALSTQ